MRRGTLWFVICWRSSMRSCSHNYHLKQLMAILLHLKLVLSIGLLLRERDSTSKQEGTDTLTISCSLCFASMELAGSWTEYQEPTITSFLFFNQSNTFEVQVAVSFAPVYPQQVFFILHFSATLCLISHERN